MIAYDQTSIVEKLYGGRGDLNTDGDFNLFPGCSRSATPRTNQSPDSWTETVSGLIQRYKDAISNKREIVGYVFEEGYSDFSFSEHSNYRKVLFITDQLIGARRISELDDWDMIMVLKALIVRPRDIKEFRSRAHLPVTKLKHMAELDEATIFLFFRSARCLTNLLIFAFKMNLLGPAFAMQQRFRIEAVLDNRI